MPSSRVLTIGLDGFELSLADEMICEGLLPNFRGLRERSVRWLLDHGLAKYSGLAWEHVSSGISPQDSGRWSAVDFDPSTYAIEQRPTRSRPFFAQLSAKTVLFDLPYCDIAKASDVSGLVNWGAHDPGVEEHSRPKGLRKEIRERFGRYPASEYIYGFLWPSPEKTRLAAEALVRAVEIRSDIAHWLLTERFPDWQLAFVVASECHSAIEPMWHGIDQSHPLHEIASAPLAREGLRRVYVAIDSLIGKLLDSFPDATALVFSMHGMGPNRSDVPSMCLLGELLYRRAFGQSYMREIPWSKCARNGTPLLSGAYHWYEEMRRAVPLLAADQPQGNGDNGVDSPPLSIEASNLDWMPVSRYRCFWPKMQAFALPSFYDGRVRINLVGRESHGTVTLEHYRSFRQEIIELVRKCRDLTDGAEVVEDVHFEDKNPYSLNETEADIYIFWRGTPVGFSHPTLGQIGPIPYYRTGGHTGEAGFLYASGRRISATNAGRTSSFDVVPTIVDLLGEPSVGGLTGKSLKPLLRQKCYPLACFANTEDRGMRDPPTDYNYPGVIAQDKSGISDRITDEPKESGEHANLAWNYYWERVGKVIASGGAPDLTAYLSRNVPENRPLEIFCLSSHYCGDEINLARRMIRPYRLTCTALNEAVFDKPRAIASAEGLSVDYEIADLNSISIPSNKYDLIVTHTALHHVINLEHLFEQMVGGLSSTGILHITEVLGKNRKLISDENVNYANYLLDLIPKQITKGIRVSTPDEELGIEGSRREDIIPVLRKYFSTIFEHRHDAFVRFICTHPELGPIFDPRRSDTRRYLDFLIDSDDCVVRHRILRPLELWGIYKVRFAQGNQTAPVA